MWGPHGSGANARASGRSRWCAGPGRQGGTRRWVAGLLARSERGVREERAQERGSAGAGPAGPLGERNGPAGAKLLGRGEREKELGWVGLG